MLIFFPVFPFKDELDIILDGPHRINKKSSLQREENIWNLFQSIQGYLHFHKPG